MGTYCSNAQVAARLPYRTFSGSSSPSTSQIDEWIDEAEAMLHGLLNAVEVSTPISGTDGIKIMRSYVLDYAVGQTRIALAAAGGDGDNDAGIDQLDRFYETANDIVRNPMKYSAMLAGGSGSSAARTLRGYQTDNDDSKTVSGGDFKPKFTTSEGF